jgi:UDP-N-acetylmuramate-alanine ligase
LLPLKVFSGALRKWESRQGMTIIDDYAHHPVEIRATLMAAKAATKGRVIAVLEPHRYSRLATHFTILRRVVKGQILPLFYLFMLLEKHLEKGFIMKS